MTAGAISQAQWRRRNAVQAVNDALVELRVADRLLREAKGLPIGDAVTSSRVASDPAGATVPVPAGSAVPAFEMLPPPQTRLEQLVWPPEWSR